MQPTPLPKPLSLKCSLNDFSFPKLMFWKIKLKGLVCTVVGPKVRQLPFSHYSTAVQGAKLLLLRMRKSATSRNWSCPQTPEKSGDEPTPSVPHTPEGCGLTMGLKPVRPWPDQSEWVLRPCN